MNAEQSIILEKENKRLRELLVELKNQCAISAEYDSVVYQCTYCSSCVDMACFGEDQKEMKHEDDCLWCEVNDEWTECRRNNDETKGR